MQFNQGALGQESGGGVFGKAGDVNFAQAPALLSQLFLQLRSFDKRAPQADRDSCSPLVHGRGIG
jgi:hypothetical protein